MTATVHAHYRITTKLDEGAMGEVWHAADKANRDATIDVPEGGWSPNRNLSRLGTGSRLVAFDGGFRFPEEDSVSP